MIKLIATDIDGTILIPEGSFTQEIKNCINSLMKVGIKVVLVTGRMNIATELIAKELNLTTPIVSYQGGLIKCDGKTLYEQCLTKEQTLKILNWAEKENIHINLYNNDILYSQKDSPEVRRYTNNLRVSYTVRDFDLIEKNKINKLLAIDYNNPQRIDILEHNLQEQFPDIYIVKSTPYFLEFSNPKASKYHAVKFLQKYWNFKDEEILTIGDQNNDIELLRAGGIKVAMGNATDKLKSVADYVTDTVENNGFVKAVERFVK